MRTKGSSQVLRRRRPRLLAGAATVLIAVVTLSACSSGTGKSGGPAKGSQAGKDAAAAKALVAGYLKPPAKLSYPVPLKSKPPAGKTIAQLTCEVPQCQQIGKGAVEAGKALGWTVKVIQYNSQDTSTFIAAMNQALQYHPVMVGITAVPQAVFQGEVAKYKQAGVLIDAEFTSPVTINSTVVSNPGGHYENVMNGKMLGQWMISDSKGSGQALAVGIKSLPTTYEAATSAVSTIKQNCRGCKASVFDATLAQVGNNSLVSAVVSQLQKNPSIKYVITGQAGFTTSLPAALKAAGMNDVKLIGAAPTVADEKQLTTGQAFAFAPLAFTYEGWQLADAAARAVEGMPVPDGQSKGTNPTQLITKANVGSGTPPGTLEAPEDYRDQFKKLWHVG